MLFGQQSRNEGPRVGLMAWRSRETARLPIGYLALQSRGTARLPVGARRPCTGLGGLPALQGPQGLDSLTGSAGTCRPGRDCNPCRAGRGSPHPAFARPAGTCGPWPSINQELSRNVQLDIVLIGPCNQYSPLTVDRSAYHSYTKLNTSTYMCRRTTCRFLGRRPAPPGCFDKLPCDRPSPHT